MDVVILAAGDFPRKEYPRYLLDSADRVVCCDGAIRSALRHGVKVDVLIGDMDSASATVRKAASFEVVQEDEQETNDLTKAMRYVMTHWSDVERITMLGATGKREAHTIGNLSLLMEYEKEYHFWERGIDVQMVSDWSTAFAVGGSCSLHVGAGRPVSLFTCDTALKLHSTGLQWPLDGVAFDNWWKASLNRATADVIDLQFLHPAPLLIVLD